MKAIRGITYEVKPSAISRTAANLLWSLKAELSPPVGVADKTKTLQVEIASLYPVSTGDLASESLTIELRRGAAIVAAVTLDVESGDDATQRGELELRGDPALSVGAYEVRAIVADAPPRILRRWYVTPRAMDDVRDELRATLRSVETEQPALKGAIAQCAARVDLLTSEPSEGNSAEFLLNPIEHQSAVESEIAALRVGTNPYRWKAGEYWRVIPGGAGDIAMRIYVPSSVAAAQTPARLVIALHGAGGDEQMFMYGYGAGKIKALGDRHQCIIATPVTNNFLRSGDALDRLLDSLGKDYAIDAAQVFVLGHSLGAGATLNLARSRADRIAAAAAIATGGFGFGDATRIAPTWVIVAENDLIARGTDDARANAAAAVAKGLPVEFRQVDDYGHTLVVGHVLSDVFEWFFSPTRAASQPASAKSK
ncbi:MAG: hypothetical protein ACKVS9_01260, partial [Phycisphaerae bacterium]